VVVKPFVRSNKNDFVDAEAIAEAVGRKNMRFIPIKTDDQLDLQAIHRVRGLKTYGCDQPVTGISAGARHGVRSEAGQAEGRHGGDP